MVRYLAKRLCYGVISLALVACIVFGLTRMLGDPVLQLLPPEHTPQEYQALRSALGYDRPLATQFFDYLGSLVTGDLGTSTTYQQPVLQLIIGRLPVTATLAVLALAIGYTAAVFVGFVGGFRASRGWERAVTISATLGAAFPTFATGITLIVLFGVTLRWLPAGGWGGPEHYVLPVATLALWSYAGVARVARSSMQSTMDARFLALATAKGLSRPALFISHAVRPSMPPVVSYSTVVAGTLFSGAVIVERLFSIPGLGSLAVSGIENRDIPLAIGVVLFSAAVFILLNLLSDLVVALLNPQVRLVR